MKKILIEKLPRVLKARKHLERVLDVKITNKGREFYIESKNAEDEYFAEKALEAFDFGFRLSEVVMLKKEGWIFEVLDVKRYASGSNLPRVMGRLIGKAGKTKQTISNLSNCSIVIKDNSVGILGPPENIESAQEAVISIAKGSKQSNIYAHLEKTRPRPVQDLGLKE